MFCSKCGAELQDGMIFCPYCGTKAAVDTGTAVVSTEPVSTAVTETDTAYHPVYTYDNTSAYANVVPSAVNVAADAAVYKLILISKGTCTLTDTRQLIRDVLGYTLAEARQLTDMMPVEVACNLTYQQAVCLAQVLTEYGIQVAVYNGYAYVDISNAAVNSVFDSSDNLNSGVENILMTLAAVNRVRQIMRWGLADPYRYTFMPRYERRGPKRGLLSRLFERRPHEPEPRRMPEPQRRQEPRFESHPGTQHRPERRDGRSGGPQGGAGFGGSRGGFGGPQGGGRPGGPQGGPGGRR